MRRINALAVAAALSGLMLCQAAEAQVPGLPPMRQLPEKEAVQVVDGALQLGPAPAPTSTPARHVVEPKSVVARQPGKQDVPPRGPVTTPPSSTNPSGAPLAEARALNDLISDAGQVTPAASGVKPPPPELIVRSGSTQLFAIARTHLNRLITPFETPVVKTTAVATSTSVDGSVVYVATESPGPVTMFIVDANDPVNAISLTMVPREIPAIQVNLRLQGYVAHKDSAPQEGGEGDMPVFQQRLRTVLRALAQREIPQGFSLETLPGRYPPMRDCVLPGLSIEPAQAAHNGDMTVVVARVRNTRMTTVAVDERMCASDNVLAVASWPRTRLAPGEETELFVALRDAAAPTDDERPSTLAGGSW